MKNFNIHYSILPLQILRTGGFCYGGEQKVNAGPTDGIKQTWNRCCNRRWEVDKYDGSQMWKEFDWETVVATTQRNQQQKRYNAKEKSQQKS